MRLLGPLVCALLLCAAAGVTPPKGGSPAKAPLTPPKAGGAGAGAATKWSAAVAKELEKEVGDFRANLAKAEARLKVDMDALAAASKDAATAKDMALYRTKCQQPAGSKAPKITAKEQAACKEIETKRKDLIAAVLKIRRDLPKPSARVSNELRWAALLADDAESSTNSSATTESSSGSLSGAKSRSGASKLLPPKQKSKPVPAKKQTRPALLEVGIGTGLPRKDQNKRIDVTRLANIPRQDGSPTNGRVIPWFSFGGYHRPVIEDRLQWFTETVGADCIQFEYSNPENPAAPEPVISFHTDTNARMVKFSEEAQHTIISCEGPVLADNPTFAMLLMRALGFVSPSRRSDAKQHIQVIATVADPWYDALPPKKRSLVNRYLPFNSDVRRTYEEPANVPYDFSSVLHPPQFFQLQRIWNVKNRGDEVIDRPQATPQNLLTLSDADIQAVRELYCTPSGRNTKAKR